MDKLSWPVSVTLGRYISCWAVTTCLLYRSWDLGNARLAFGLLASVQDYQSSLQGPL